MEKIFSALHNKHFLKNKTKPGIIFAFLDQGIFSSVNFLINILLGRWLSELEYGVFSIGFAIYLLASTIQGALVLEPMSVYGATDHGHKLPEYLGNQLKFHLLINLITGVILLFVSYFVEPTIRRNLLGVALFLPITFLIWFYRRACYIQMQTKLAALISLIYAICMSVGVFFLFWINSLNGFFVFTIFGLSSLLSGIFAGNFLKINFKPRPLRDYFSIDRLILSQNWQYGKWILVSMVADTILSLIYIPLIAVLLDIKQAAGFRAIQNLTLPLRQLLAAVSLMTIPWLSREVFTLGQKAVQQNQFKMVLFYTIPTIAYSSLLSIFSKPIVNFLYSNEYYNGFVWMVPFLLLSNILSSVNLVFAVSLRSLKISRALLFSKVFSAAAILSIGIIFVYLWHLAGVLLSIFIGVFIEGIILYKALYPIYRQISFSEDV